MIKKDAYRKKNTNYRLCYSEYDNELNITDFETLNVVSLFQIAPLSKNQIFWIVNFFVKVKRTNHNYQTQY